MYHNKKYISHFVGQLVIVFVIEKASFYKKQNLDLNFILFLIWRSSVIWLKAKRNRNMKKHFIEAKNFGGFVTFYLHCVIKHKDIWNAIKLHNLRIRNNDPRFHLVWCYKKHFLGLKWKTLLLICMMLLYVKIEMSQNSRMRMSVWFTT